MLGADIHTLVQNGEQMLDEQELTKKRRKGAGAP